MNSGSEKTLYLALSHKIIEEGPENQFEDDPLANINKSETYLHGDAFEDDTFKLTKDNLPKGVVIKRLRDILQIGSSLKEPKYNDNYQPYPSIKSKCHASKPTYLSQLKMIPEKHFLYLIEPQTVNEKGFYHVAAVKQGRIIKKTVDDYVYYDEITKRIYSHPFLEDKPWIHIIVKVWAKLNKGYENLPKASPFQFIKAFTYPDWSVYNPSIENLQAVVRQLSSSKKSNDFTYIVKTKDDPMVGAFGLIPNNAAYLITGYFQEYGNIFIKIRSFSGDKWNGKLSQKKADSPSQSLELGEDQFIMPIKQFVNVIHLIYFTNNKFNMKNRIFYHKYTVNLDARESKAKLIRLEVVGDKNVEQEVNLNLYFPSVQIYDIDNKRKNQEEAYAIPYCKILLGRELQVELNQSSYADSVREKMLKNQGGGQFLSLSNQKFEYVRGDYFKGYSNDVSYHLKLKPGNYILRLKIEKLLPQYRALLNITSSCEVKISENKNPEIKQQFLAEVLSSKARQQQLNTVFPSPNKKQTWIMMNNNFDEIGYGSILFQIGKNDQRGLTININNEKIKKSGYRLKNLSLLMESRFKMYLKEKQSKMLILKEDLEWKGGERAWPPEGIDLKFDSLPEKLQTAIKL